MHQGASLEDHLSISYNRKIIKQIIIIYFLQNKLKKVKMYQGANLVLVG